MVEIIYFDNYDTNFEFSNWYPAEFELDGRKFSSVEQFMMYSKAMLFGDSETAEKMLNADDAAEIKALGRQVKNYNDRDWNGIRQIVVYRGNLAKFRQHPELAGKLMETKDAVLAECEPTDRIWGIGMAADDERRFDEKQWIGTNLLGFTLMEIRRNMKEMQ